MGISRKFMLINLGIIFFNAFFGMIMHLALMNFRLPIRERYVQLSDDSLINDPQVADEMRALEQQLNSNYTTWEIGGVVGSVGGCQNHTERRSPTLDPGRGLLDRSRSFKIHPFTVTGDKWADVSKSWQVCLSTQTTVNLLFWVSKQAEMWEGPISVSVFTPDVDYTIAIKMILYLQTCFPGVRNRVAFHMVYSKDLPPKYVQTEEDNLEYDCSQPESVNDALMSLIRTDSLSKHMKYTPYPQNLMRNLAREGCHTDYSFTPDVDMVFIPGISKQLNEFFSLDSTKTCEKCAYVIPTYEIHTKVTTNPVNKDELKALIKRKKAQRFHIRAFKPNQANSKLQAWEKVDMNGKLDVLYNVTTWKNYWEPIYITKSSVPYYDERFVGYGFTRNSQVYEMHVADYSWFMLNDAFLCHRGFQVSKRKNTIRRSQIKNNSEKYKIFRQEVYARYGKNEEDYEPKKGDKDKKDNELAGKVPPEGQEKVPPEGQEKAAVQEGAAAKEVVPEKPKKKLQVPRKRRNRLRNRRPKKIK